MHCKFRAMYCRPTERPASYFCEACATHLPADDKQWSVHAASEAHVRQLESLQFKGALGHMPEPGHDKVLAAANLQQTYMSHQVPSIIAGGSGMLDDDPSLTKEQLQHFGCTDCEKILGLQLSLLQARDCHSGQNGLQNADINYHNLHGYWATVAMRLSCALKTERKRLKVYFEPGELACLAQILKQKTDLRGLLVYGHMSSSWACFGDALAVNMLLQALPNQPQLEGVEFLLERPEGETISDVDSEDEPECLEAFADENAERLYQPAWQSVHRLLDQNTRSSLRHASFMLPYKRGKLKEHAEEAWVSASNGFRQKQSSVVTAILMGRHVRLGAQSNIRMLPENMLKDIIKFACPPPALRIWNEQRKSYTFALRQEDGTLMRPEHWKDIDW